MRCVFPGMDPYLERPEIWPDFHDSLITYIREAIQPLVRPKYAALTQNRLYVVESDRPIRPDISVVQTRDDGAGAASVAVEADQPRVIELAREEIRQPFLLIVEPAVGNRIVTAIEVLSPDNKSAGAGRESYLRKRAELWQGGANCVEIDLLRAGASTVRCGVEGDLHAPYVVAVSRYNPPRCEHYAFTLRQRLPRVSVPLAFDDADVVLDLQAVFERCYEAGPYPELLRYDQPPMGPISEEDAVWCREQAGREEE